MCQVKIGDDRMTVPPPSTDLDPRRPYSIPAEPPARNLPVSWVRGPYCAPCMLGSLYETRIAR